MLLIVLADGGAYLHAAPAISALPVGQVSVPRNRQGALFARGSSAALGNVGSAGLPKPATERNAQALETCAQVASCATVAHCSVKQGAVLG